MKAKLLKEQMGVPAGTELEVLETGRAWTLKAPSGAEIVVPSCDCETVSDDPNQPVPGKPLLLVTDDVIGSTEEEIHGPDPKTFGGQPQPVESDEPGDPEPTEERTLLDDERDVDAFPEAHYSTAPSDEEPLHETAADDDLDEELPEPQGDCDGEACESCT